MSEDNYTFHLVIESHSLSGGLSGLPVGDTSVHEYTNMDMEMF